MRPSAGNNVVHHLTRVAPEAGPEDVTTGCFSCNDLPIAVHKERMGGSYSESWSTHYNPRFFIFITNSSTVDSDEMAHFLEQGMESTIQGAEQIYRFDLIVF